MHLELYPFYGNWHVIRLIIIIIIIITVICRIEQI